MQSAVPPLLLGEGNPMASIERGEHLRGAS